MIHVFYNKAKNTYEIVKDGFNIWVILFGVFYLIYKRLWKESFLYICYVVIVYALTEGNAEAGRLLAFLPLIPMSFWVNKWRMDNLTMRGYVKIGTYATEEDAKQVIAEHLRKTSPTA